MKAQEVEDRISVFQGRTLGKVASVLRPRLLVLQFRRSLVREL